MADDALKLLHAMQNNAAASIAAAIITSAGRPHSVVEALEVLRDVQYAMYPNPGSGRYEEWKKENRLQMIHK